MSATTQDYRTLSVTTPLGKDQLLLAKFEGTEQISGLFRFELEMWSEDHALKAIDLVGKGITFSTLLADGTERCFHGIVSRFFAGVKRDELRAYRAEVVPQLWQLTQTTDCRIFQNQSVVEIIKAIFADHGLTDFKTSGISGTHSPLEYCVQYRETDFAFVSRLMEQEGIFYFFQHRDGGHTLVLGDSNSAFQVCAEAEVEFSWLGGSQSRVNRITDWEHRYEFRPGRWTQSDQNFIDHPAGTAKIPFNHLKTSTDSKLKISGSSQFEKYEFPGRYPDKATGTSYTQIRMEAEEAGFDQVAGSSRCASFSPGTKFKITSHDCPSEDNTTWVFTRVTHRAEEGAPYRRTSGDGELIDTFENQFLCIPQDVPFRPLAETPKPVVHGSQTAVVTGPPGEEIWPDQYGRVRVQFFWDREGERDAESSCWVRVQQSSAGKGWGAMFLPRVGQEVVVSFLEGDPDRPLITGVVYNADQMPAYVLPDNKTRSYVRTNSSAGGEGFNELRFEDLAEKEQIFLHAQRNLDTRVLHDSMEHVLNDRHLIVGHEGDGGPVGNQYEKVMVNKELHVLGNQSEKIDGDVFWTIGQADTEGGNVDRIIAANLTELIGGNKDLTLAGNQTTAIEGTVSLSVAGDRKTAIDGGEHLEVTGVRNTKLGGNESLSIGGGMAIKTGDGYSLNAGGDLNEKIGGNAAIVAGSNAHIKGGAAVVIEAGSQLTLKVGGNFVVIDASGVSIKGAMVNLNSGGSAGSGSGASPESPEAPEAPDAPAEPKPAVPTLPTEADDTISGAASIPGSLS
ncbi:MAG: type VI secretion system tip protein VgrG [Planctomycetaceae bacterium]|nr:type VI secretion system tip protein VgrG [Planctomycetaceae bacterium]